MSYQAKIDFILHLHEFISIDLLQQGIYYLKLMIYHKDSKGRIEYATPMYQLQCEEHPDLVKKINIVQKPKGFFRQIGCDTGPAEDSEQAFTTKKFPVRFNQENEPINTIFVWKAEFDAYPNYTDQQFYMTAELFCADFSQMGRGMTNQQTKGDDYGFVCLSTFECVINHSSKGINEYFPIQFQGNHYCQFEASLYTSLLEFKFSLSDYQQMHANNNIKDNSILPKLLIQPTSFMEFLNKITYQFQEEYVQQYYEYYVLGLRNTSAVSNKLINQLLQAYPELINLSPVLADILNELPQPEFFPISGISTHSMSINNNNNNNSSSKRLHKSIFNNNDQPSSCNNNRSERSQRQYQQQQLGRTGSFTTTSRQTLEQSALQSTASTVQFNNNNRQQQYQQQQYQQYQELQFVPLQQQPLIRQTSNTSNQPLQPLVQQIQPCRSQPFLPYNPPSTQQYYSNNNSNQPSQTNLQQIPTYKVRELPFSYNPDSDDRNNQSLFNSQNDRQYQRQQQPQQQQQQQQQLYYSQNSQASATKYNDNTSFNSPQSPYQSSKSLSQTKSEIANISTIFNLNDFKQLELFVTFIESDMNIVKAHLFRIQQKLLEILKICGDRSIKYLKQDYILRMKERWGESVRRTEFFHDLTQPFENKTRQENEAISNQFREKMEIMISNSDPLDIDDLKLIPKTDLRPFLLEEIFKNSNNTFQYSSIPSFPKELLNHSHVIVLCHGFQGNSFDMRLIKNNLLLRYPNAVYLSSKANEENTQGSIADMGKRLAQEVIMFLKDQSSKGKQLGRLSFIGHSLGGVIIRSALVHLSEYSDRMYLYMSMSSPHLGYMYNNSKIIEAGIWLLRNTMNSECLEQLHMNDQEQLSDCYLYKLSASPGLGWFRNIALLCSYQDQYVPFESARIQKCHQAAQGDMKGRLYNSMVDNLLGQLRTDRIHRIDVNFKIKDQKTLKKTIDNMIGRSAHIQFLENDALAKTLVYCFDHLFE